MSKAKKAEKVFQIQCQPDETEDQALARTVLNPALQSAGTIQEYSNSPNELDLASLIDCLETQVGQANDGNLNRIEQMHLSQAHTLDAIANNLFRRAIGQEYLNQFETFMKLGLKAQSQCRATLEALVSMKKPSHLSQTNIAHGHQQVNNFPKKQNPPDELMEKIDDRLDTGTPQEAVRGDQDMAAMAASNGAKNEEG